MATMGRNFKTTTPKVSGEGTESIGYLARFLGTGAHARNSVASLSILLGTIAGLGLLIYCVVTDKIEALQLISSLLTLLGGFVVGFLYGTTRRE